MFNNRLQIHRENITSMTGQAVKRLKLSPVTGNYKKRFSDDPQSLITIMIKGSALF